MIASLRGGSSPSAAPGDLEPRRSDPADESGTVVRSATGSSADHGPTTRRETIRDPRRARAEVLGRRLAELVAQPDDLVRTAAVGLNDLSDPATVEGTQRVAPGIGAVHGVTWPMLASVERAFRAATRHDRPALLLPVAERLMRAPTLDEHWLAFDILERVVIAEPELAWQLLRRGASTAADWITVDTLAHPYGRGILAADYRWAEIEQLVYSPSRWERRLVGSTIATIPFVDRRLGREPRVAARALPILRDLIGDDAAEVQKAMSWALRSLTLADPAAVLEFCEHEASQARGTADGHRAWVIRDALPKLDPADAERLRALLAGVRKRPGAASTSRAAETAAAFTGGGLLAPSSIPQPPPGEETARP